MSTYRFSEFDTDTKFYADVKYELKDLAKECGAKWDWKLKKWYFENTRIRHEWDMEYSSYKSEAAEIIDASLKLIDFLDKLRLDNHDDALSIYMSYDELLYYLYEKYGQPPMSYFDEEYNQNWKANSRTKEGLEIHHIDEDKYLYLSSPDWCKKQKVPFECQQPDRLVYCNKIEHLLLHIRIAEEYHSNELRTYYTYGIKTLISKLNDYYEFDTLPDDWNKFMIKAIEDRFDDYVLILFQIMVNLGLQGFEPELTVSIILSSNSGQYCSKVHEALQQIQQAFEEYAREQSK